MSENFNREGWLHEAAKSLAPILKEQNAVLPERLQISCSWPRRGKRNAIGQCWGKTHTQDGTTHVFISPVLGEDPTRVLDVLLHELIHAACGVECGHRGQFAKVAKAVGLTGKMTATVATDGLRDKLVAIATPLGPYPHSVIRGTLGSISEPSDKQAKQVTLRSEQDPNYFIRMSREMFEIHGSPLDPWGNELIVGKPGRPKKNDEADA